MSTSPAAPTPAPATRKPRPKRKGKNYAEIHSKPLPLTIHALPPIHPTNPLSLLHVLTTWFSHLLNPPSSHPTQLYIGYFSPETRSVHVTDPEHVRALWEMGFFGKGTLSRSEPSWLERERARLRMEKFGAEDATAARREERRAFKMERARLEAEKIRKQREVEEGYVEAADEVRHPLAEGRDEEGDADGKEGEGTRESEVEPDSTLHNKSLEGRDTEPQPTPQEPTTSKPPAPPQEEIPEPQNQEHLTLTLEEAFFLTYTLGLLKIYPPPHPTPVHSPKTTQPPYTTRQLLTLFIQHTPFPPTPPFDLPDLAPDDEFLLTYTTYHHYRSLGWVVRPGIKFGVTFLLYNRGPVFSHAEFGVVVVPAYTDRFWNTPGGRGRRRDGGERDGKDWWWLHAVNRVQSQVKKTLVLCYVDVPSPLDLALDLDVEVDDPVQVDIGRLLGSYKVREVVVRRWLPNRSRD